MPTTKNYLPTREADLIEWAVSFNANISKDPASFGLTLEDATDYAAAVSAAQTSVNLATDPATRTGPVVQRKAIDLQALKSLSRSLVKQIQARPRTTDEQRRLLAITIPDKIPTRHGPPTDMPDVDIVSAVSRFLGIEIRRTDGERGKPAGCIGANVYYAVSDTVPTTSDGWTHAGLSTRLSYQFQLPDIVPAGATVWVAANYINNKGEVGPLSNAVSTNLPGGQARLAA